MRRSTMGVLLLLLTGCGGKAATMAGGRHVAAAAASTAAAATSPETAPQTHTFILFADVTRSLTPQEQASVIANVQTVIGILPAGAHLYVFPLLEDVQRADAVFEGALPQIQTSSDAVALDMLRAKWNKVVAEKLQAILAGPPNGRNLTCVSGAFRKAEELTGDAGRGTEIVVISDMLEDCGDSLLHGSLQLQKASIERELAAARALPREQLLRLDGASVTAILPTVPTSGQRVARPPVHELKAFWRAVLDRCGDNAENFRFGTTVPKRLHDYKPPEEGSL